MFIPNSVKIGGKTYNIIYPYTFVERFDHMAQINNDMLTIFLTDMCEKQPLPKQQIEESLLHEIIHAVDYIYNANKLDEDTISRLSEGLYQVLNDNGFLNEGF